MVATLEVSQLETSASKFFKLKKSPLMSVMAETSQSAMGPHFAVAAVGLASNSRTESIREVLVVKIQGGGGADGGDAGGGSVGGGGVGDRGGGLGDSGGGEGDGGGGLGDGGGGDGDGEGQVPGPQFEQL